MGIHEVTRGQFGAFIEATGYKTEAETNGRGGEAFRDGLPARDVKFTWQSELGFRPKESDSHPVVNVSWQDAIEFCKWISAKEGVDYRLPFEAEWNLPVEAVAKRDTRLAMTKLNYSSMPA